MRAPSKTPALKPSSVISARLGIAPRLGIAFGVVAALAVAANLLAQRGISIIETTKVVPRAQAPRPVARVEPLETPGPVHNPAPARIINTDSLVAAIDRFDRAVQTRVDVSSPENSELLRAAERRLTQETAAYALQADGVVDAARLRRLAARIAAYRKSADELVQISDRRRETMKSYWERFEVLDARMKQSLDRAWKIFGRVIARQSSIDLSTHLDEIRRRSAAFAAGASDKETIDAIVASESAFLSVLEQNERGFARSQGADWVAQMRADFADIGALRGRMISADEQRRRGVETFARDTQSIAVLVRARLTAQAAPAGSGGAAKSMKENAAGAGEPSGKGPAARRTASAPSAIEQSTVTRTAMSPEHRRRAQAMAWISAGVLLMLLVISIATVRSIVRPVRELMAAIRRIAGGEAGVRVPRGGIRELDALAVAFNQMAEQLNGAQAIAREYQGRLEAKVDERTRQLQHLAEHDPLTQLPNRRQLFSHLEAAIERAAAGRQYLGVFFLDLDNFKNINDSMGHAFGDRVLKEIANRLREASGASGFAARLGGDEFTVVHEGMPTVEDVREAGWNLVRAFQKPLLLDAREIIVSVSVGASLFPDHEQNPEALLRAADAALFRAKALGRSQLTVFSPELLEAASSKFSTEQGLRRAVERGEFELVFQPEVAIDSFEVGLVEALLRWRLPDGRRASPAEFLTVAEESGLIMEISDWVLRFAIESASRWHHGAWPEARIAINVSSRQLLDSAFVDRVQSLLREFRLPARCIELELTENVLQTGAGAIEAMRRLRAHGVAIALDDFGTGYSSLASLEHLPLTRVKLDRSLIASVDTSARSAAIARAIIGLCQNLGLEITAEGIERPEQLGLLLGQRGVYVQGFLLSRPVSSDELLPVMATLGQQMQSLLLSTPVPADPPRAEPAESPSISRTSRTKRLRSVPG